MDTCKLSARIELQTGRHTIIGVFQNGGKAGTLTVDAEHGAVLIEYLNNYPAGTHQQALLAAADKVCAWAEHDRGCHGPHATGSCTCGLQEARGAYQALKETQDG